MGWRGTGGLDAGIGQAYYAYADKPNALVVKIEDFCRASSGLEEVKFGGIREMRVTDGSIQMKMMLELERVQASNNKGRCG